MIRSASLLITLVAASGVAQTHTRTPLLLGQEARFEFSNMPTASLGSVMFGFGGAGQGLCVPSLGICLGVLDPVLFTAPIPSDPLGNATLEILIPDDSALYHVGTQGLWMNLSTPTLTLVVSNAVDGYIEPLSYYDESFDADAIDDEWQILNGSSFTHQLESAELQLTATTAGASGSWGNDVEGGMLYRELRGDFMVTTPVRAFDPSSPDDPPQPDLRLGGLIIRDPASTAGNRNWIGIGIGGGSAATPLAITALDTFGSVTTLVEHDQALEIDPPGAELRLIRDGDQIYCQYRNNPVLPFSTLHTATNVFLPPVLQVGMFVSAASAPPGVTTAHVEIRFSNLN